MTLAEPRKRVPSRRLPALAATRVSNEELAQLRESADSAGVSVSTYLRLLVQRDIAARPT